MTENCYRAGLFFDVTNERLPKEHGQVRDGKLYLGKAVYDTVILGDNVCFEDPEVAKQCKACGILREDSESGKIGCLFLLFGIAQQAIYAIMIQYTKVLIAVS